MVRLPGEQSKRGAEPRAHGTTTSPTSPFSVTCAWASMAQMSLSPHRTVLPERLFAPAATVRWRTPT